jgi:hypothetical protein
MINFEGEYKVSANEFSKLFIARSIDRIIENMDEVFTAMPELYCDFTEKEKADVKDQMQKRADGLKGYLSIDKLKDKIKYVDS